MGRSATITPSRFRAVRKAQLQGIPGMAIRAQYGVGPTSQNEIRRAKTWPKFQEMKDERAKARALKKAGARQASAVKASAVTELDLKALRRDIARLEQQVQAEERRTNRVVKWVEAIDKRTSRRWWQRSSK